MGGGPWTGLVYIFGFDPGPGWWLRPNISPKFGFFFGGSWEFIGELTVVLAAVTGTDFSYGFTYLGAYLGIYVFLPKKFSKNPPTVPGDD